MAGTFTKGVSNVLSGVYSRIVATISSITAGTRGVVAYPFTSNWGPINVLKPVNIGEFNELYNAEGTTLTANKIYKHAANGAPSKLLAYRMATTDAKAATCSLGDNSLQLETLYPTDRAFTIVVKDGVADSSKTVELIENSVKLLSVTDTTVKGLAEQLNTSDYVRVTNIDSVTTMPANTNSTAFTGGNNGDSVKVAQYTSFLDDVESDATANALSLDGVTDTSIITTVVTWLKRVRQEGFYVTFVTGGASDWDANTDAANTASVGYNNRAVINVGNGCDGYTSADMAIFVAARVAAVALNRTLTDETVPYTKVNKVLKKTVRETAKQKGTLLFVKNGDYVEIDEGVNTLTAPGDGESKEFGKIRVANTLDYVTKDLEAFGNEYKKTKSNTAEARQCYATLVEESYLKPLINDEVIKDGCYYKPDPEYHGDSAVYTPAIDEAYFVADITPVDSMERIYQTIGVNF